LSYNHHVQPGPRFQSRKKYRIWGGRVKARTAPRAPRSREIPAPSRRRARPPAPRRAPSSPRTGFSRGAPPASPCAQ